MGNWGQHSFLDPRDAANDYKTAMTCIGVEYNANAFNDGYHTSHHLNPIRHWQDHPESLVHALDQYKNQNVTIFQGLDFFMVWGLLMLRQYNFLAHRLVCFEEKNIPERVRWMKDRLKRLSKEDIKLSFGKKVKQN